MRVIVDKQVYRSKKEALKEFQEGMLCCDGSESERYAYAYSMLLEGYNYIDTYKEVAEKRVKC
jgi:hypothetical protein